MVAENVFLLKSLVRLTNALGLACLGLQHLSELGLVCADSRVDIIIVCPSLLQQSAAPPAATPAAAPGVLGCMICVCLSAADSNRIPEFHHPMIVDDCVLQVLQVLQALQALSYQCMRP